jgi:hypothetical protein
MSSCIVLGEASALVFGVFAWLPNCFLETSVVDKISVFAPSTFVILCLLSYLNSCDCQHETTCCSEVLGIKKQGYLGNTIIFFFSIVNSGKSRHRPSETRIQKTEVLLAETSEQTKP